MRIIGKQIFAASAMAAMLLPGSALAQEARDFADKLSLALSTLSVMELEFGSAVSEGDSIILSDISVGGLEGTPGADMLDGVLTFTGVSSTPEGGYVADRATFGDVDVSKDGVRVQINNIAIGGVEILGDPNDIMQSVLLYKEMEIGPLSVMLEGSEAFSIQSIVSSFVPNADNTEFAGDYAVSGIFGNLSMVDDSDVEEAMAMFGLSEINASMNGSASWSVGNGLLSIQDSTITIDGVGQLGINLDLFGYTLDLMRTIQEQGKAMQNLDPSSSQAELAGLQMLMGMAAQMSLGGLSIRFDDDALTYNIIDFIAAEQGESRKGFISMVSSVLPMMLGPIGIPVLQQQISDAAIKFLADPQNIEINASPAEPVPFMALMAAVQNPSIANDLLNISVTANQ